MNFFKKLFGKKEPKQKSPTPNSKSESKLKTEKEHITPSDSNKSLESNPSKSIETQEKEMQEGIKEMFEESKSYKAMQWMKKNNAIKDEDLIKDSMDKIFPRLKRGTTDNNRGEVIMMPKKEGENKMKIPAELSLVGYDSGPDFCTSFAIDHDQMFTLIYKKHLTLSGMTKEELLQHACKNFQEKIGPTSRVTSTIFPNVYQLQTDGNSEATTFLFPTNWTHIKNELGLSKLFLVMPAQNTMLFWDTISEETKKDLIQKVTAEVATYPRGSIVSNYLYELQGNEFVALNQFFKIGI
jgi:Protein of unknown function (DUF1444).